MNARLAVLIVWLLSSALASAEPQKLGAFVGTGYLASPGGNGVAAATGLRLSLGNHFAVSLDTGYGLMSAYPVAQDRWWIMPSLAVVIPTEHIRFDLGTGLGVGTSSGFKAARDITADRPIWAFEAVPTIRFQALAAVELNRTLDLFARLDVATMLTEGNTLGIRDGSLRPGLDTTWANLWIGVQFRVL